MAIPTEFLAALAGAAAGGGASLAGSVIVNRRELIRSSRVRLHEDLLPDLKNSIDRWADFRNQFLARTQGVPGPTLPLFEEVLAATKRSTVLAGQGAMKYYERISQAHERYDELVKANFDPDSKRDPETLRAEKADARVHLVNTIDDFAAWIESKILWSVKPLAGRLRRGR